MADDDAWNIETVPKLKRVVVFLKFNFCFFWRHVKTKNFSMLAPWNWDTSILAYFIHTVIKFRKSVSDFTFTNQRGETSFSHVKKSFRPIVVFSRAFSRSYLSGSFDKIYTSCS